MTTARKPSLRMAAVLGVLAGMGALQGATSNASPFRPRRHESPSADTTRRYCGMTQEQRDWNAAIDAKKAAK